MTTDLQTVGNHDLAAALRAQAAGYLTHEAAVQLLEVGDWLLRMDLRKFIDYSDDPDETGGEPLARVRWAEVVAALDSGELYASGAAGRVLRIAASLAGGVPVDLRDALSGLGSAHAAAVVRAVAHATGV